MMRISPGPWHGFPGTELVRDNATRPCSGTLYWRINNNAETEIMETAVETRMALEVRVTYTSYWRATIKTLAAIGSAAPSSPAVAQSGSTSKRRLVVR